jgi:ketosteroid isomerase-like protein
MTKTESSRAVTGATATFQDDCGARVVAEGRMRGRTVPSGVPLNLPFVHIWTVYGGRLVGAVMYTDTAVLRDALAGRPVSIITP